jgi:hypothetical protein
VRDEDYQNLTPQAKAAYDVIRAAGYIIHSPDVVEKAVNASLPVALKQAKVAREKWGELTNALSALCDHLDKLLPENSAQRLLIEDAKELLSNNYQENFVDVVLANANWLFTIKLRTDLVFIESAGYGVFNKKIYNFSKPVRFHQLDTSKEGRFVQFGNEVVLTKDQSMALGRYLQSNDKVKKNFISNVQSLSCREGFDPFDSGWISVEDFLALVNALGLESYFQDWCLTADTKNVEIGFDLTLVNYSFSIKM